MVVLASCVQERPPPRMLSGEEPCPLNEELTRRASQAAAAADANPENLELQRQAIAAGRALGEHRQAHHAKDMAGDLRGAFDLRPAFARAVAAAPDCESKREIGRIQIALQMSEEPAAVFLHHARACLTGLDAASTPCQGKTPKAEVRALIAEVWPRASAAEWLPMLRTIAVCTEDPQQLEANLSFVPADARETFLSMREAEWRRETDQILRESEARSRASECEDRCMHLYAEYGGACGRLCGGFPDCMDMCSELGRKCDAACSRAAAP